MLRIIPSMISALAKGPLEKKVTVNIFYSTLYGKVRRRSCRRANKKWKEYKLHFRIDPFHFSIRTKAKFLDWIPFTNSTTSNQIDSPAHPIETSMASSNYTLRLLNLALMQMDLLSANNIFFPIGEGSRAGENMPNRIFRSSRTTLRSLTIMSAISSATSIRTITLARNQQIELSGKTSRLHTLPGTQGRTHPKKIINEREYLVLFQRGKEIIRTRNLSNIVTKVLGFW